MAESVLQALMEVGKEGQGQSGPFPVLFSTQDQCAWDLYEPPLNPSLSPSSRLLGHDGGR